MCFLYLPQGQMNDWNIGLCYCCYHLYLSLFLNIWLDSLKAHHVCYITKAASHKQTWQCTKQHCSIRRKLCMHPATVKGTSISIFPEAPLDNSTCPADPYAVLVVATVKEQKKLDSTSQEQSSET